MLQGLDAIPWAELEHAYGAATDVPELLRQLLDPDPKVRRTTLRTLYGNVFHQGTRYPATIHVIPFLIEMCASPEVPNRGDLLRLWGSLIAGYFNILERPVWGDGEQIHNGDQIIVIDPEDPDEWDFWSSLHQIYRASVDGHEVAAQLLADDDHAVRAGAAGVLACLPTLAAISVPQLLARLRTEPSGWVRAALAFALGELGAAEPLRSVLFEDSFPAAQCMAACELARIEPTEALIGPLLQFISEPIEGYENIPGAGGKSTGDAAYSVSLLPVEVQCKAIPAICDRLDQARCFETIPLVRALLAAAFPSQTGVLTELNAMQRYVLVRMVNTEELWSMGDLSWSFKAHGLTCNREKSANLIGIKVADDEALKSLRGGLAFADIGFLDKGREGILKALELDPAVFERAPGPDESWLLCAKAFAEAEPERALAAYRHATEINPGMAQRVNPTWRLADLLRERNFD